MIITQVCLKLATTKANIEELLCQSIQIDIERKLTLYNHLKLNIPKSNGSEKLVMRKAVAWFYIFFQIYLVCTNILGPLSLNWTACFLSLYLRCCDGCGDGVFVLWQWAEVMCHSAPHNKSPFKRIHLAVLKSPTHLRISSPCALCSTWASQKLKPRTCMKVLRRAVGNIFHQFWQHCCSWASIPPVSWK